MHKKLFTVKSEKLILYLIILLGTTLVYSQDVTEKDYTIYHNYINKAEEHYFINKDVDSSLLYYELAIKKFDFIFLKDLINAAQISCFNKKRYRKYIKLGFKFGLKIEQLKEYPIFEKDIESLIKDQTILKSYTISRKEYISSIDFDYLNTIYDLAIKDQLHKSDFKKNADYLADLKSKIHRKGFPGDRIIGIDDSDIFNEIGSPELGLKNRIKKYPRLSYFKNDDHILGAKLPFLLLVHHRCSFEKLMPILKKEIKKGNIHPREVGMLHDNVFRFPKRLKPHYCSKSFPKSCFLINNAFTTYPKSLRTNTKAINKLRASYNIVPLEVDLAKKEHEEAYGFKLFSGFWNCR